MKRSTNAELHKKIEEAKAILRVHNGLFTNPAKVVGELEALDLEETGDIWKLIQVLLEEVGPGDYAGSHPPKDPMKRQSRVANYLLSAGGVKSLKKECISNLF